MLFWSWFSSLFFIVHFLLYIQYLMFKKCCQKIFWISRLTVRCSMQNMGNVGVCSSYPSYFLTQSICGNTLKYRPFYGICFFDEILSFFNLVSDFFSEWNFIKNGFYVLVWRYWFPYIKNYKNYFFKTEI